MEEVESIISISLSSDDRFLLVNLASGEIHAWDLRERALLCKYRGQKQGRLIARAAYTDRETKLLARRFSRAQAASAYAPARDR